MPIEINIPEIPNFVRLNIPLDIPSDLVNNGAIELYAMKFCNWTPTIIVDEEEIANPKTAATACAERIRGIVKEEYAGLLAQIGAETGRKQALDSFESKFPV